MVRKKLITSPSFDFLSWRHKFMSHDVVIGDERRHSRSKICTLNEISCLAFCISYCKRVVKWNTYTHAHMENQREISLHAPFPPVLNQCPLPAHCFLITTSLHGGLEHLVGSVRAMAIQLYSTTMKATQGSEQDSTFACLWGVKAMGGNVWRSRSETNSECWSAPLKLQAWNLAR